MKKLFLLLMLTLSVSLTSFAQQNFQGTLTYGFKFMGEGIEGMEAFLPTSYTFQVYKTSLLMKMEGGMAAMMMGNILVNGKKGEAYMIKDAEKIAYKMPNDEEKEESDSAPVVEMEDETIEILGYECQKYKVTTTTPEGEVVQYVWATDKLKFPEMKGGVSGGMGGSMAVKGVKGLPLKTMVNQGPMTVTLTATEIKVETLDKNMFKVPKGYDVEPFNPDMFGGMGM